MTDPLFTFEPIFPFWITVTIWVAASGVMVWLESRKQIRLGVLRIVATILLCVATLGFLLAPRSTRNDSNISILLTEGYSKSKVDSLLKMNDGASVFHLAPAKEYGESKELTSAHQIPNINIVVGHGLTPAAADVMDDQQFVFITEDNVSGILNLNFPEKLEVNSIGHIQGRIRTSTKAKLKLAGPGGVEDSTIISQNTDTLFTLNFTPRQPGSLLYQLSINDDKGSIPIAVEKERRLNIFVIQIFPTFETGYLKSFLAKNHNLVLRYQLSKNIFRNEYINHPSINTERLTTDLLKRFDLIIIDSDSYESLSAYEQQTIAQSVHSGLGALILFNDIPKSTGTLRKILPVTFEKDQRDTAVFPLQKKKVTLPVWPVNPVNNGSLIPSIRTRDKILAGYAYKGFGKVGFQNFQQTYKLILQGDSSAYEQLWNTLLLKNARTKKTSSKISVLNNFPMHPFEPIRIEVLSSLDNPTLTFNGSVIPMREHSLIDDVWEAKVWAQESGWQQLRVQEDSTTLPFFVSPTSSWNSLRQSDAIHRTSIMATNEPKEMQSRIVYEPFGRLLFFALFIISAATLWLIPKI